MAIAKVTKVFLLIIFLMEHAIAKFSCFETSVPSTLIYPLANGLGCLDPKLLNSSKEKCKNILS